MQTHWYVIYAQPGYEHQVKATIMRKIRERKMKDFFGEILVPTEKVFDFIRGSKQIMEGRMFPGYLLAQITLADEAWHLIRSIPRAKGFIGKGKSPTPPSEVEVQEILNRMVADAVRPRPKRIFTAGEKVKIIDGPFRDFTGTVEEFNPARSRVKVSLSVFGRPTPVVLEPIQVEAA